MDRPAQLLAIARDIAAGIASFQDVLGPGPGDRATNAFMRQLRNASMEAFGDDLSERYLCGATSFAVDFYFAPEETIVEVALGLPNPACEFEKDILKAIMAQDLGYAVRRLYFISRAGAVAKCDQPGRTAIREWAWSKHGLAIEVHELGGVPRVRPRRRQTRQPPQAST